MPLKWGTGTGSKFAPGISKEKAQIGQKWIGSTADKTTSKCICHSQWFTAGLAQDEKNEEEQDEDQGNEGDEEVAGKQGPVMVMMKKMSGWGSKATTAATKADTPSDDIDTLYFYFTNSFYYHY